jgi:hypothetical protein
MIAGEGAVSHATGRFFCRSGRDQVQICLTFPEHYCPFFVMFYAASPSCSSSCAAIFRSAVANPSVNRW